MAPREIEILTMTKLERDGHQSTPAEKRKIKHTVNVGSVRRDRSSIKKRSPIYQWKKPTQRR